MQSLVNYLDGSLPRPRAGAGFGTTVGYASGLGFAGVIVAIGLPLESEQSELDAIQKELEKYRKPL